MNGVDDPSKPNRISLILWARKHNLATLKGTKILLYIYAKSNKKISIYAKSNKNLHLWYQNFDIYIC